MELFAGQEQRTQIQNMASHCGYLETINELIAAKADVNKARTDNGLTPLFIAIENVNLEIIN